MSELLTVDEVAQELRLTPDAVRRMIRQGRIAGVKIGKRLLVARAEMERIKTEGTEPIKLAGGRIFPRHPSKGGEIEQDDA